MKTLIIFLTLLMSSVSYAGCNPCVCGPGGGYDGSLEEWWQLNCGGKKPRPKPTPKTVLCYNKTEDQIQSITDMDEAISSEELTACSLLP